ncbi:hypothetical protein D3C87_1970160 [compost metagenome]
MFQRLEPARTVACQILGTNARSAILQIGNDLAGRLALIKVARPGLCQPLQRYSLYRHRQKGLDAALGRTRRTAIDKEYF